MTYIRIIVLACCRFVSLTGMDKQKFFLMKKIEHSIRGLHVGRVDDYLNQKGPLTRKEYNKLVDIIEDKTHELKCKHHSSQRMPSIFRLSSIKLAIAAKQPQR